MVKVMLPADASLPDVLAARARAASDSRLVADVIGGVLAVVALSVWRPWAWLSLAGVALAFAAFGSWGIADRELQERGDRGARWLRITLTSVRVASVIIGAIAAMGALLTGLGVALGTWIS